MQISPKKLITLQELPAIIAEYVREIPVELVDRKRSREAWTIREHIYHIADVQEMLLGRIEKIIAEDHPVIEPYFPENDVKAGLKFTSIEQALDHYQTVRIRQLGVIKQARSADLEKSAMHKEYTDYSIPIIVNHLIFHEYWHMYRIEEIWLTRDEYFH